MTDRTIKIIHVIKRSHTPWNKALAEYLARENERTPDEYSNAYSEYVLNSIMKDTYLDYIKTCDNPCFEICKLIDCLERFGGTYSLGSILAVLLQGVQVRTSITTEDRYVNGFDERVERLIEEEKEEENNG